jgi:hypothetical protein
MTFFCIVTIILGDELDIYITRTTIHGGACKLLLQYNSLVYIYICLHNSSVVELKLFQSTKFFILNLEHCIEQRLSRVWPMRSLIHLMRCLTQSSHHSRVSGDLTYTTRWWVLNRRGANRPLHCIDTNPSTRRNYGYTAPIWTRNTWKCSPWPKY